MTIAGWLESVAAWVWDASWHAAVVVGVVLIVRMIAWRQMPAGWRCALWSLVLARLLLVWTPQASLSLFGMFERFKPAQGVRIVSNVPVGAGESADPRIIVGYGSVPVNKHAESIASATRDIAARSFPVAQFAMLIWIVGAISLLARTLISRRRLDQRLGCAVAVDDPRLLAILDRCRAEMNVRTAVAVLLTDAVNGPALTGIWRPRILLPLGLPSRLSLEQLRFVFLHELAHVRRQDVLLEWALAAITALHWFNPAVWIAAYLYRADRELCRDEMALRAAKTSDRSSYGHTLLHLMEMLPPNQKRRRLAVAMLIGKHRLKQRISMIAQLRPTPARVTLAVLLVAVSVIAWVVLTNPKQVASTAPTNLPSSTPATHSLESQALAEKLDRRLPEVRLDGLGLEDTIAFLREVSGANIVVNWHVLESVGIHKDSPVTARMKDVRLSKALSTILADVGGGNARLSYAADGGVITISTYDELNKVVTRIYDIRDLLETRPDYDSDKDHPVGFPSSATHPVAEAPLPLSARVAAMIKLVRETIDPTSWQIPGRGSIQELNGQLVITQTPEAHEEIVSLFKQLRETRSIQILTTARFVVFDPGILPDGDAEWTAVRSAIKASGAHGTTRSKATLNDACLSASQTAALLGMIEKEKNGSIRSAPKLTTFNGQRAYVLIQTQRAYVADFKVIRDDAGKFKSYEPIVDVAASGLTVDLQATVSADRKYVTTSIRPKLAKLLKLHTSPFLKIPADHPAGLAKPTVQEPEMLSTEFAVTVSIPDAQTLVIDCGEDAGQLTAGETEFKPRPGNRLYALVTPRIILDGKSRVAAPATRGSLLD
jgi:bla regulator protein BlaR1